MATRLIPGSTVDVTFFDEVFKIRILSARDLILLQVSADRMDEGTPGNQLSAIMEVLDKLVESHPASRLVDAYTAADCATLIGAAFSAQVPGSVDVGKS